MSYASMPAVQVDDFLGAYPRREPTDIPTGGALVAKNVEFNPGTVGTRRGFGEFWNANEPITSMYNWVKGADGISLAGSYLLYYNSSSAKVRIISNLANPGFPTPTDLITASGHYGISCAQSGPRLIVAVYRSVGDSQTQASVIGTQTGVLTRDVAFTHPTTRHPSLTATGGGSVTAGVHRVGFVMETQSGYQVQISPAVSQSDGSWAFDATSIVTSAGNDTIAFSITGYSWPAGVIKVYPVMTTTTNLNRYYYVGTLSATVVPGSTTAVNFTLDKSDDDLVLGSDATPLLRLLCQTMYDDGPFNPFGVEEFGLRTVYLTTTGMIYQAYISEPSKPQYLTADQHVITLPGFRKITAGKALGNTIYWFGPHWTYASVDTGDVPVAWAPPALIDGSVGTIVPNGVSANPSSGMIWVPDVNGLYLMAGGQYVRDESGSPLPVSYEAETDWRRINWAYAHEVRTVDHASEKKVVVLAPLDSATTPSHMLVFDYTNGTTPSTVKYSLWDLSGFTPGDLCVFQNPTSKRLELLLSSSSAGKILRQKTSTDSTPYRDDAAAIDSYIEEAPMPGARAQIGTIYRHPCMQMLVAGNGTLKTTAYGKDRVRNFAIADVTLSGASGKEVTRRCDLLSEYATVKIGTNAVDEYFVLSSVKWYYEKWAEFR